MYMLSFYVPKENLETVKSALFSSGAGRVGDYDSCCWQVRGEGQFRPLEGSDPHIGTIGEVEKVVEYRVELVCEARVIRQAVEALREAHPYEEPAYTVVRMEDF